MHRTPVDVKINTKKIKLNNLTIILFTNIGKRAMLICTNGGNEYGNDGACFLLHATYLLQT